MSKSVQTETAQEYAKQHNMLFFEVSSETGENIQSSIESLLRKALENYSEEEKVPLFTLKSVIIGDAEVGKTSIVKKYIKDKFSDEYHFTIGSDLFQETLQFEKIDVPVHFWDTAGRKKYLPEPKVYQRADCCIIVYDISKPESFDNIKEWLEMFSEANKLTNPNEFPFLLLGNKSDLSEKLVQTEKAQEFAKQHNMLFSEVSAKTGENIDSAINSLYRKVFDIWDKKMGA